MVENVVLPESELPDGLIEGTDLHDSLANVVVVRSEWLAGHRIEDAAGSTSCATSSTRPPRLPPTPAPLRRGWVRTKGT
jgi:hypothetical protein